jgi:hypothetical protein
MLVLEPDGQLTAVGPRAERTVVVPDLALSNLVELWCGDGRAYLIGLKGRAVWYAVPSEGRLTKILELDRLDLQGSYDPGGLHRVEFHELPDGDLLIVYEFGLARLGRDGSVGWQAAHHDITARLDRIADGIAWLLSESGPLGFRLTDGGAMDAS